MSQRFKQTKKNGKLANSVSNVIAHFKTFPELVSHGILSQPLLLPLSSGYLPIKDCSETAS